MPVESVTYISDFNTSLPAGSETKGEGDNHIRNLKLGIKQTFPNVTGPVTATHTTLSNAANKTGDTYSGNQNFTGANLTVATPTNANQAVPKSYADGLVISATAPAWTTSTTAIDRTLASYEATTVTASGRTITAPASPVAGFTRFLVHTRQGVTTTINFNGANHMNTTGTMTVPFGNCVVKFFYKDSTEGWVIE